MYQHIGCFKFISVQKIARYKLPSLGEGLGLGAFRNMFNPEKHDILELWIT